MCVQKGDLHSRSVIHLCYLQSCQNSYFTHTLQYTFTMCTPHAHMQMFRAMVHDCIATPPPLSLSLCTCQLLMRWLRYTIHSLTRAQLPEVEEIGSCGVSGVFDFTSVSGLHSFSSLSVSEMLVESLHTFLSCTMYY